jgi:hypothetical protein
VLLVLALNFIASIAGSTPNNRATKMPAYSKALMKMLGKYSVDIKDGKNVKINSITVDILLFCFFMESLQKSNKLIETPIKEVATARVVKYCMSA